MTTKVSIREAKSEFAALITRAEQGEEFIVTRNGKPVARMVPLEKDPLVFGDLAGVYVAEDLSLPEDILDGFDGKS